jgi:perosamine synthetase
LSAATGPTATPAGVFVPLCAPEIGGNEWHYVKECLDTGWVSSVGPFVDRFEAAMAGAVGARHAVAMQSGTAALHLALLVAGVERDDEVLVSSLTFIAPANAIRYAGAWPVFVDAEPEYWQMDVAKAEAFLETDCVWRDGELRNRLTGRRIRALLPVHILGHPVSMDPLRRLAQRYGLALIEDATESLGAEYRSTPVGRLGDVACFSFNGNKLLTTGGGGMLVTDNPAWATRARYLSTQAKQDALEYVHGDIGYNYRLTNVQAAIGVAQIERLPEFLAAKRRIAAGYEAVLGDIPGLTLMAEAPWARSAWWMYTVLVDEEACGVSSRQLLTALEAARVQTRPLWQPLHRSAAHADACQTDCSVAERLNREALSLPCSVGLTPAMQDEVIERLLSCLGRPGVRPRLVSSR